MYRMSRHFRPLLFLCLGVALETASAQAQTSQRSPAEIGQMIDAAVSAIIPGWERHASSTIAERGIRFGYAGTLAAFGYVDDAHIRASLGLASAFTAGSDSLLEGCDQMGSQACSRLGRSAYMSLEPIAVSGSEVVLWVHVVWATTPANSSRTYRSSSSTEVFLSRSGSGPWRFVKLGRSVVS